LVEGVRLAGVDGLVAEGAPGGGSDVVVAGAGVVGVEGDMDGAGDQPAVAPVISGATPAPGPHRMTCLDIGGYPVFLERDVVQGMIESTNCC
jgi:hypothetical protein